MTPRPPSQGELRAGTKMWGSKPAVSEGADLPPAKATMKLAKFVPITTDGPALAFVDIETPSGLILRDCKLMRSPGGGYWIAMPSQKQLDRDGNPILDERGKPRYRNFVDFRDKATRDRFTEQVIGLVRREHPDIVGDEA
jgi:DNA-binding cell septation regulator SpoVG